MTVFALLIALAAAPASAASPRFTNIMPHGGQRGTEVDVTLYGTNLQDAEEVLVYDPGLEVVSFAHPEDEKQKGRQLKVRFRLAENAPLGSQRLRIRTRTGLSELQNFHVGALPVVMEAEPNTQFDAPQVIEKNVTVHGRVDREDVDYYVVECKKGERLSVEVFGLRLGYASTSSSFFDPSIAILDENRFELATEDDSALVGNDSVASVVIPEDGKYYVQIRDAAYGGDGRAYYLLHVGNFPRPRAVIPAGGKPGETLEVTLIGDPTGPFKQTVTLPTEVPEHFALEVSDEQGVAPSSMPFRLSDLDNFIEQEPNNSRQEATPAAAPGAFNGALSEPGDIDFFKFSATKGQVYEVEVYGRRIRSPIDSVVYIYRMDNGGRVAADDDKRRPDSYVRFTAPEDGEYVVAVRDHLNNGGPEYAYRVELTPVTPQLVAKPLDIRRYVQPDFVIPQGAGRGVVLNVTRQDIGGPVNFRSEDLPPGVRIECPEGWRAGGQMSFVMYADEDAPVGGHNANVTVHLDDPKQADRKVEGPVMQELLMVRGRNNNYVWTEEQRRLAVVVTEKAPFRVSVETPKVPLVRGGSMQLRVTCEKDEGWDEDIQLLVLQNPSGVNSSRSVKIPKGKTEALIPMNAAGNAAVRETMIAVRAIAKVGGGSVETCTPFFPIRVEEQYATFEFAQAAIERGKEGQMLVTVTKRKDWEGEAEVKLLGLPANATAEPLKLTSDMTELTFTVKTTEKTPISDNKNVFCQLFVPEAGTTILHSLGKGRLRVDPPPPQPKTEAPKPKPQVAAAAPAKPKPLSRLEQLRLQAQQLREQGAEME
ncbi:MAG: PPC domain-containing protein [Maioricimonas sp. JB045]